MSYNIIGLGNPGQEYIFTRHNIGFLVLDELARDWQKVEKGKYLKANWDKHHLIKPLTFMNLSGLVVKNLSADSLIVVHDDLDLPFGQIKISFDRGSGGHKGVDSIVNCLGSKSFIRLRIGVGKNSLIDSKHFVLADFNEEEKEKLTEILTRAKEIIEVIVNQGYKEAMNRFN